MKEFILSVIASMVADIICKLVEQHLNKKK